LQTCWQQVVVVEFGKRHDAQTQWTFARASLLQTCYGEVTNLLRTYYGETGVMDFGLSTATAWLIVNCK